MLETKLGKTKFINLCPHDVVLVDGNGMKLTFKASGQVARLDSDIQRNTVSVELAEGLEMSIPTQEITDGDIYGLPEAEEGTIYITSYIIAKHAKRPDVISPLTDATAIRDSEGKIQGVRGFQRFK